MHIYYRISNNSYAKDKLWEEDNKYLCLINALNNFVGHNKFTIIADNVTDLGTTSMINDLMSEYDKLYEITRINTSLGNAQSFQFMLNKAIEENEDDEIVYFLEDDYFHAPVHAMANLIKEGLERANYVSLYDHPDKYQNHSEGGDNPYIEQGGEVTRVILTRNSHWKLTNSTTMTFAAKISTLKADKDVWMKWTSQGSHPNDFQAFLELGARGRSLITPIPGVATHTEKKYLTPFIEQYTNVI